MHDCSVQTAADDTAGPLVLTASRSKWSRVLAMSLGFVAMGVVTAIGEPTPFGWVVVAFFGSSAVISAGQLLYPSKLVLDATTVTVSGFGRGFSRDLASCSSFEVWRNPVARQELVVFNHPLDVERRGGRASTRLSGHSSALPDTYGLPAAALAAQLSRARSAALARGARP